MNRADRFGVFLLSSESVTTFCKRLTWLDSSDTQTKKKKFHPTAQNVANKVYRFLLRCELGSDDGNSASWENSFSNFRFFPPILEVAIDQFLSPHSTNNMTFDSLLSAESIPKPSQVGEEWRNLQNWRNLTTT